MLQNPIYSINFFWQKLFQQRVKKKWGNEHPMEKEKHLEKVAQLVIQAWVGVIHQHLQHLYDPNLPQADFRWESVAIISLG